MEVIFFMIVIQLLCNGFQTFMDMAWISVGYGPDIEGGGDSLLKFTTSLVKRKECTFKSLFFLWDSCHEKLAMVEV